jgi:signal transduction histidine kinase
MTLRTRATAERETSKLLDEIDGLLSETTKELRNFTYILHPPHLENDGLAATLQRYVDGFGQRTGLKTTLRVSGGAGQLPLPLQRSILRIVQEALANVHRHAAATRVSVNLRFVGKLLHLVISDDGKGFEKTTDRHNGQPRAGVGLPGMTARIQQFGGKLDIRSGPKGSTVHAAVPIG